MVAITAGELFSTNIYISWITFENRSGSKWRNDHTAHSHSKRSPRTVMKKIFAWFLKGNKLRTSFNSSCQIICISKNNIMLLFFRKRARIFAYKVSDQINTWPKRHRVIFSIIKVNCWSYSYGPGEILKRCPRIPIRNFKTTWRYFATERPQRISIHSTDNIGKGLSKDLALDVE